IVMTSRNLSDLDTDPSLLTFFHPEGEITEGLRFIDRNGGSSPLVLVLKDQGEALMNEKTMYKRLWALQRDLEQQPDVGTVISLPTLLAEGKRRPFSFLLSSEKIISKLEEEQYSRIAQGFVSTDRRYGLFLLRMKEEGRSADRLQVIAGLEETVRRHHFVPHLLGGIYALQGHLSQHVASSLIYGLARLILVFSVIALFVSRSIRIALAMTVSISIVPVCILGLIGYYKIPLDTISAPAANVAIAMGIDAMIHMVHAYRRLERNKEHHLNDWLKVRRKLWEPVVTSMFIICSGFGIFFMSKFPPTQRFGAAIVFGTVIAAVTALFIFPLVAKRWR
ncbi:MAG: MMPL family transporter, partial [Candidatus Omnitrophica bacterium]|nr:MMPL family transporter [Candidatus Omnitrophota bacterium]